MQALAQQQAAVLSSIGVLENRLAILAARSATGTDVLPADARESQDLQRRQALILGRTESLLTRVACLASSLAAGNLNDLFCHKEEGSAKAATQEAGVAGGHLEWGGETEARIGQECLRLGMKFVKFRRVAPDYYDRPLEWRQAALDAPSVEHLCKSIVMVNTQAPESVVDCSNPKMSKYYVVIVQYCARLNTEKLRPFLHALSEGAIPKKRINMRLAPEATSDELTGFTHNSVCPVGMATQIPVILSDRITKLEPNFFWMGGGEVDLKLCCDVKEFIAAVNPFIVDCTE
eukprot:jgi/Mesvir1/16741/Mv15123-RA.1